MEINVLLVNKTAIKLGSGSGYSQVRSYNVKRPFTPIKPGFVPAKNFIFNTIGIGPRAGKKVSKYIISNIQKFTK